MLCEDKQQYEGAWAVEAQMDARVKRRVELSAGSWRLLTCCLAASVCLGPLIRMRVYARLSFCLHLASWDEGQREFVQHIPLIFSI